MRSKLFALPLCQSTTNASSSHERPATNNPKSMLGSVITARERWLKPGGLILPSTATLYIAPVTHPDRYSGSVDFWRNVYGIDMSAMLPLAKQCAFEEPSVETISGENVLTWPHVLPILWMPASIIILILVLVANNSIYHQQSCLCLPRVQFNALNGFY